MHRLILGAKEGQCVDHINGDPLDNRKENIRICTLSQNSQNRRQRKDNTSGLKGVSWAKREKKWVSYIRSGGKHLWLGYFNDKNDAAKAYDKAVIKYRKPLYKLNFSNLEVA